MEQLSNVVSMALDGAKKEYGDDWKLSDGESAYVIFRDGLMILSNHDGEFMIDIHVDPVTVDASLGMREGDR